MSTAQPPVEILFIGKQLPDGGYTAHAETESIFTEADTLDGLRTNIREAVECHYGDETHPRVVRLRIVREEIFRLDG
jgi:predicted RNase H-like HicB family nuclease